MRVNIILLAAGKGQRFQESVINTEIDVNVNSGDDSRSAIKQLAEIEGESLILRCIKQLSSVQQSSPDIVKTFVTLGANQNKIQAVLPKNISVITSQHYSLGMGHTLAESIKYIQEESSHAFIALSDQALIPTDHFQALLKESIENPHKIIATQCDNRLMAPAIFPEIYFPQLIKLQGDKGAGQLLKQYTENVHAIPCQEARFDIDTVMDLENVKQQLSMQPLSHHQNLEPV